MTHGVAFFAISVIAQVCETVSKAGFVRHLPSPAERNDVLRRTPDHPRTCFVL